MTNARSLPGLRLFTLGFLTLYLELLLIRYLAGTVWNLGYFPNLVLMGVFIGMGCGFLLHQHATEKVSRELLNVSALVLAAMMVFVFFARPAVPGFDESGGTLDGEAFFTAIRTSTNDSMALLLALFGMIVVLSVLISQRTAKLFRSFAPLTAYTLDIGGSCVGILVFMAVSWLQIPAYLWLIFLIVPYAVVLEVTHARKVLAVAAIAGSAWLAWRQDTQLFAHPQYKGELVVRWSPYQKVEYIGPPARMIFVNGIEHQSMLLPEQLVSSFYAVPYRERQAHPEMPPYRSVLVIGAGSGNDALTALIHGASSVDAVEIDPVIARMGMERHPGSPYQDPRIQLTIDDGRAFMSSTKKKYDLIIFALTDSLVKVSSLSQLRLENYLFTKESVSRAYELLSEGGTIVLYNYYRYPWLTKRLQAMIHEATGKYPLVMMREGEFAILGVHRPLPGAPALDEGVLAGRVPTDDWPFLYLKQRRIPAIYWKGMLVLGAGIAALLLLVQRLGRNGPASVPGDGWTKLAFLAMGAAFLLLETKSIIQFSLLFGTTWLNSSLVFLGILVLVLLANWTAAALRTERVLWPAYGLVVLFALWSLYFPLSNLLYWENRILRFAVASVLTFAPVFFGNLIFSAALRNQPAPEHLFGWNLVGATIGGMLEYTSMIFGYRFLAVLVAVSYTVVFIALRRRTSLARMETAAA
jgi:hypothetical protein